MTAPTAAGHETVQVDARRDGWWAGTCQCGMALPARRSHTEAEAMHTCWHLEQITRSTPAQLALGGIQ